MSLFIGGPGDGKRIDTKREISWQMAFVGTGSNLAQVSDVLLADMPIKDNYEAVTIKGGDDYAITVFVHSSLTPEQALFKLVTSYPSRK